MEGGALCVALKRNDGWIEGETAEGDSECLPLCSDENGNLIGGSIEKAAIAGTSYPELAKKFGVNTLGGVKKQASRGKWPIPCSHYATR